MDMASFRRPRIGVAANGSTALDYPMLVALLNAAQGGAAAVYPVPAGPDAADQPPPEDGNVIDLIEGGPAWRQAIVGQAGSFHRDLAQREFDPPSAT